MSAVDQLAYWTIIALSAGSVIVGSYVGYQAYRGFRRHDSRPMQYLSIGLFLLTAVAFGLSFVGSVLLRMQVLPPRTFQQPLTLLTRLLQFVGVFFIAYSLHKR
ncbi:DUF7521 family protein [Halorientalis sp.]|jgi:hypothetical protein|uniref:DUF7521 family protein n=1 Tax=Halorientalis sp. TaxID=1931229 RepID=UPI0026030AEB|nr:hypothetical protein [Halorientalis sp.]